MSRFDVQVLVVPRPGLLDPQGKAVHHALSSLGYDSVTQVRVGKAIHLEVEAASAEEAQSQVDAMCRKLLANPVTEHFQIAATPAAEPVADAARPAGNAPEPAGSTPQPARGREAAP